MAMEDGYALVLDGKICLLTTDNHGLIEKGGGVLSLCGECQQI